MNNNKRRNFKIGRIPFVYLNLSIRSSSCRLALWLPLLEKFIIGYLVGNGDICLWVGG
jgi:hypothetical protein